MATDGFGVSSCSLLLWEALILTLVGFSMVFISLSIMNATAFLSGRLARVMLGKLGWRPTTP